ncbi:phage tail assembly protein [Modicisalibacter sp. MOD 31.J]|uniref:phage tail assembly protein n=1 Tax=Modicisalibacter sp. MOD 31.J TaxID=2831897 RepID=UPI001CCC5A9D|nr:phage tail assembly protein [Modicisalibacter sp. MOD 31.J]MBZ9576735.1 phage tail assembly protein [Modicisalibacter sp. MOD 31.J]
MENAASTPETPAQPNQTTGVETVVLDEPIARGKTSITEIHVRKPKSGALRGVALTDVLQMDVQALTKVLPRITDPALTEAEIRDMDPADLVQLGGVVAGFLLPRSARVEND